MPASTGGWQQKIGEFERLKEFNENIVESINVGILALDLEDRIESWNAQMEAMYALSRAEAHRPDRFAPSFPSEFVDACIDSFRNEQGVHHLYKFRLITPPESAGGQHRDCTAAVAGFRFRGAHHPGGRHYRPSVAGVATGAGGQAQLDRPAGRRRGA
jgi:PAS domain-containing protein